MRKTNKILSFVLALVMILSSMSVTLFASAKVDANGLWADPKAGITQSYVTDSGNANAYNATVLLDWLDSILKDINPEDIFGSATETIKTLNRLGITIDINSVDGILKTLDTVKGANSLGAVSLALGSTLVTKKWEKGQTRAKTGDVAILNNLLQFCAENEAFIGDFVANKTNLIDIDMILGCDLPTYLKKTVSKLIYGNESAASKTFDELVFECALGDGVNKLLASLDTTIKDKYVGEGKNEVWTFLYNTKGFKFEGSLNGFKYDKTKTLDYTVTQMINQVYQNNKGAIKALFEQYGTRLQNAVVSSEWGAPFASLLKLNTTDLSFLDNMSMSGSLKSFNSFAGTFVAGVTTYKVWDTSKNFGANFQKMFMWAINEANKSDVANNPYKGTYGSDFSSYALTLAKIIVKATVTDESVVNTLNNCKSAQEVITKLLPVVVKDNGKTIVGKNSKTYEQVLGDILGYYLNSYAILYTDTANKTRYTVSSGKTYLEVLNYAANYYLCDLNFDTLLGVDCTKNESFLSKLDKLQAKLFTGTKTLQYSKASTIIPDVIKAIMNLDFESLVKVGFEDAFTNINTNVSAANLVCYMLNNTLNGVLGVKVFEEKYFESIEKMLSNDSLNVAVGNLLVGLNNRKAQILPVALYLFNALSDQSKLVATVSAKVQANGKAQDGNVKVYNAYNKKALVKGTDYTVTTKNSTKPGTATVVVTGKGNYAGSVTLSFKIVCEKHNAVAKVTKKATYTTKGTRTYTCSYCGKVTKTESIGYLAPAQVKNLKATNVKQKQLKLTWSKADGAANYEVYKSTDGKKWTKVTTTSSTSCTVKNLKAGNKYQFKVRAVSKMKKNGSYSSVLKTGTMTAAVGTVTLKSTKSKQVSVSWKKVTGASKYIVQYSTDKNFKKNVKSTTVTKTSATLKKLTGGKKIYVRVIAVNAYKVQASASKAANIKVKK